MNTTRRRRALRIKRQKANVDYLVTNSLPLQGKEAHQYILFGGPKGKSEGRPYESFK